MATKYCVDDNGVYLGGFSEIPEGAIEVSSAPDDARQVWNGDSWDALDVVEYKIYDLLANNNPQKGADRAILPVDVDFKTGLEIDLYKEVVMDHGAPVRKIYYTDAELNETTGVITYENPIVKIEYEFDRDSISLARSCIQKFYWMTTDDAWSEEYKTVKDFFNTAEKMAEAEQRRGNIIADLKVKTIGLLMITEEISQADAAEMGRAFLAAYKADIINYIDEANMGFYDAVEAASNVTYPWLENMTPYSVTIRQFILNGL